MQRVRGVSTCEGTELEANTKGERSEYMWSEMEATAIDG